MKKILIFFVFLYSLYGESSDIGSKLIFRGATTIQPIIEQVATQYQNEKQTAFQITGGGSQEGIDSVLLGKADIGMVSRDLKEDEKSKLSFVTIGYDSLAFIVNSSNPLTNITKETLIKIYKGEITNWKSLNGKDEPIILLNKKLGRGTLDIFEKYTGLFHPKNPKNTLKTNLIFDTPWEAGANNDMLVWVGGLPNAIGFISCGSSKHITKQGMKIRILSLDGVLPTDKLVLNQTYPIRRPLNLVYKKENSKVKEFIQWMFTQFPQSIVVKNNFIRVPK